MTTQHRIHDRAYRYVLDYAADDFAADAWGNAAPVRDLIEDIFAAPPRPGSFVMRMPPVVARDGGEV